MLLRLAPTPSGFLHAGNRHNFRLNADMAASLGATLALRIDDADATRYRREYAEDVFTTLTTMGIDWQIGPRDVDDFEDHWSQRTKTDFYRDELTKATERGLTVYACCCSRTRQRGPATGGCVGRCASAGVAWEPGATALRVSIPDSARIRTDDAIVDLGASMGDVVIWRRDDLPSYHLVSIVEDRDLGTTHIVRGSDLLVSSALQIYLAPWFDADNVASATYVHHELVLDGTGQKLSKSTARHQSSATTGADPGGTR